MNLVNLYSKISISKSPNKIKIITHHDNFTLSKFEKILLRLRC